MIGYTSLLLLCSAVAVFAATTTYTTKYDNIDIDAIISNDRVYKQYYNCLTNKGKCTPDGKELKDRLPDALKTSCSKCTSRQRQGLEKVITFLIKSKPSDFQQLERIYDPSGVYRKKYAEEAKKRGIKL